MRSVLTGPLSSIICLNFSNAPCFPPVRRGDPILTLTKPSAETSPASQYQRSVASAGRGAATTPPTATAGVCMGAGAASSPPAPGPPTGRTAGTPAHSTSWRQWRKIAISTAMMLKMTLEFCCAMFVLKEISEVATHLSVWRCRAPPAGHIHQ